MELKVKVENAQREVQEKQDPQARHAHRHWHVIEHKVRVIRLNPLD